MSKDNRDMSIEEKFKEWLENNCVADQYENIRGLFNVVWLKDAHKAGYELAQKEMQEKLDKLRNELCYYKNGKQIKEIYIDEYKMIELQEKLDAAIEIINELFEWDNLTSNEIYKLQERFKKLEIS